MSLSPKNPVSQDKAHIYDKIQTVSNDQELSVNLSY